MSDVRTILIPCGACGHKTSTTVAQWSAGFACEECGATVQRPKPGQKKEEAPAPPPPPKADSQPLKQAKTISTGLGLPGNTPTTSTPPLAGAADLDSPTQTRSVQLQQATQRADDIASDIQALQAANDAQAKKMQKLIDENRELKVAAQRLSLERQSAELDATAALE